MCSIGFNPAIHIENEKWVRKASWTLQGTHSEAVFGKHVYYQCLYHGARKDR
jgi:hypothetical protein